MKNKQSLKNKIQNSQNSYAKKWDITSDLIKEKGGYNWMSGFIEENDKVLEIGCGNGNGTLELANKGHKIISIEENINCIKITSEKLRQSNITYKAILRGTLYDNGSKFSIEYNSNLDNYDSNIQVYIIEGNILNFSCKEDISLFRWLLDIAPFDGIICWLMGTHKLFSYNTLFTKTPNFATYYRNTIQFLIAQLKDSFISKNGFIHFVDRVSSKDINFVLSEKYKLDFSQDLSLPYYKCTVDTLHIGDLNIEDGIEMGKIDIDNDSMVHIEENDLYLISMFYKF